MGDYGSYKKALIARGLLEENSKEKISYKRKWLIRKGFWEQIAYRNILGTVSIDSFCFSKRYFCNKEITSRI
jgi:hypothetical protein